MSKQIRIMKLYIKYLFIIYQNKEKKLSIGLKERTLYGQNMALKIKQVVLMKRDKNRSTWIKRLLKKTSWEKDKPIGLEGINR